MSRDRLAVFSQRLLIVTLCLLVTIIILNACTWLYPRLGSMEGGYGLSFSLTNSMLNMPCLDPEGLSWLQRFGGIVLTSLPLSFLCYGLLNLCLLFKSCARGAYFSRKSALFLEKTGKSVIAWVIVTFICEPVLGLWLTFHAPAGERLVTLSFQSTQVVALFIGVCVILLARILRRGADIQSENQSFV